MVRQLCRVVLRRPIARNRGDQQAQHNADPARHAVGILLADLRVIVGKADGGKGKRHKQHHPDVRVIQPRPKQGRGRQRAHNQQPAHGWRTSLGKVTLWPVSADRLTLTLLAAQHVDQWQTKDKAEHQRGQKRPARAECDIAEQIEKIAAVRQLCQPIQHLVISLLLSSRAMPEFADRVNNAGHFAAL